MWQRIWQVFFSQKSTELLLSAIKVLPITRDNSMMMASGPGEFGARNYHSVNQLCLHLIEWENMSDSFAYLSPIKTFFYTSRIQKFNMAEGYGTEKAFFGPPVFYMSVWNMRWPVKGQVWSVICTVIWYLPVGFIKSQTR